ncbi:MAG: transglutaminase domain-containing protein [Sulfuricurvum sp.]|nr:transglutaminase domain-containing protein [Sulfuricurvum sp.]
MDITLKILLVVAIAVVVYREIVKSTSVPSSHPSHTKSKASFLSLLSVGAVVTVFTYAGMSVTLIETRDLRPYLPPHTPQMVSIFDKGVIEVNHMVIKTNLASQGELASLAQHLTEGCEGDDGCEIQKLFDYVTAIPYRSDHTSRNAKEVVQSGWGDCDDKSNLFASLLNERNIDYKFVYVPKHVFVVVHVKNTQQLPFLAAKLIIEGKPYYYAETTASGARIGEFNGQFPYNFEGIYDLRNHHEIAPERVSFRIG